MLVMQNCSYNENITPINAVEQNEILSYQEETQEDANSVS
jgi:hypothetical protein